MEGVRHDFVRTCVNEETANYVINEVVKEYKDNENWIIGNISKQELSNGEIMVTIELTHLNKEKQR